MSKKKADVFSEWWTKKAVKRVAKIEKAWVKSNEPNDPEDSGGGDHWHINQMMHDGDACGMTMEIAERVFSMGVRGEFWEMTMGDSLFCDLDEVIVDAYLLGKENQV